MTDATSIPDAYLDRVLPAKMIFINH
jgi:hypothetical protein